MLQLEMSKIEQLRGCQFDARQKVRQLRLAVFEAQRLERLPELYAAEHELQKVNNELAKEERAAGVADGDIVSVSAAGNLLGPATTGIEAKVSLRMEAVPSALVHLFDARSHPLVSYEIVNKNASTKRLRLLSYVEGYSAHAIDTVEAPELLKQTVSQLPTFFPDRLSSVTELTRATLNVEIQDLDAKTEVHKTIPLWLLARSYAPLQIKDPSTGQRRDMTRYLGAFVTPNAPVVMRFLRKAADKQPQKRIAGYQTDKNEVLSQVRAVYEALAESGVKYVNSIIDFNPNGDLSSQRVRSPRESLTDLSANCIDGTLLMASLVEAASLNPAIVIIPGHAFLGWEEWPGTDAWRYLETTMISEKPFEEACSRGDQLAAQWLSGSDETKAMCKRWTLRDLRAHGISPLE